MRGVFYALTGRKVEARRVLAQLLQAASKSYGYSNQVVGIYAQLGDLDRAFASLERTFQERDGGLIVMRVLRTTGRARRAAAAPTLSLRGRGRS